MLDIDEKVLFEENEVHKVIMMNLETMSNEYTLYFDLFKNLLPNSMNIPGNIVKLKEQIRKAFIECVCTKDVLLIIEGFKHDETYKGKFIYAWACSLLKELKLVYESVQNNST